jgi:hypothetical protein
MKQNKIKQISMAVVMFAASMLCGSTASAQQNSVPDNPQLVPGPEVDSARKASDSPSYTSPLRVETPVYDGYETKQTAEFGGRITNFGGNQGVWDTFVNLGSGPRLLEYSLDMHSPTHTGFFFDDLSVNNFGYGGDPNDLSRLRILKGTLYNFNATVRRDQNIFDYDLLANPLNPANSNPNVPIVDSPHEFLLTRRMSDLDLALFSMAPVRIKLGWSRVVNEGTTFSSVHEGTDAQLFQPTLNTSDTFRFGVALRFIPKTSVNFDQFYTYYKGDTSSVLNGTPFTLAGGIPVNLGLPFNTGAGQPCATPLLASGLVNPNCNGYLGYTRSGRNRNSYPTEQLSMQSNYFRRFDLSARFIYSDATADLPDFRESFNGLTTRTAQRAFTDNGNATAKRITKTADFGITYKLTDKLRLVDSFRFNDFSLPGGWNYLTNSLFGANLLTTPRNPAVCNPASLATCPIHTSSSSADVINEFYNEFLRQDSKVNTFQVEYDFTRRISAYVGYRYENREITHNDNLLQVETFLPSLPNRGGCPVSATVGGICTLAVTDSGTDFIPINANSALLGFSARPTDKLRFNFDTEIYYADNTLTRISPRHLQQYRARGSYKARDWMTVGASMNIRENRNNDFDIGNLQHNRSFAFTTVIAPPTATWGADFTYDYNDVFSQSNICFAATPVPPGSISCGAPFLSGISTYSELTHYGSLSGYFKPARRVTANVGYNLTSSTGNTLILNPIAPTGPLNFNYHLPMVMVAVEVAKNLTCKTGWNYYDYNEKSAPGPALPRDFHGNALTLSLRYTM